MPSGYILKHVGLSRMSANLQVKHINERSLLSCVEDVHRQYIYGHMIFVVESALYANARKKNTNKNRNTLTYLWSPIKIPSSHLWSWVEKERRLLPGALLCESTSQKEYWFTGAIFVLNDLLYCMSPSELLETITNTWYVCVVRFCYIIFRWEFPNIATWKPFSIAMQITAKEVSLWSLVVDDSG